MDKPKPNERKSTTLTNMTQINESLAIERTLSNLTNMSQMNESERNERT